MTVLEAIKETRKDLAKIPVKIEDLNEIGFPIHNAVQSLGAIINALEKSAENQENAKEADQP